MSDIVTFKRNLEKVKEHFLTYVADENLTVKKLNAFAEKYKDRIVFRDIPHKSQIASRMVLDWYNSTLSNFAETGALTYRSKYGGTFAITDHAYERGRERHVTENDMLHAAAFGVDIGRDRYDDGNTIVIVADNIILTTYKSADSDFYKNEKIPSPPPIDISKLQFNTKPHEMVSIRRWKKN